jgi:Lysophospholipase L1 and related esterases
MKMNNTVKGLLIIIVLSTALCPVSAQERDWAGFSRYAAQNGKIGKSPEVVFYGDSITELWYSLDSAFFLDNGFLGRGIGGQTTSELLVRFRQDVIGLHPKVVVLLGGINDLAGNNGYICPENIVGNIVSMCELAEVHGIKVILCSPLPSAGFGWSPSSDAVGGIRELDSALAGYASANGLQYVDYFAPFANAERGLSPQFSGDGVHPDLYMYAQMERIVAPAIQKALKAKGQLYVSSIPQNPLELKIEKNALEFEDLKPIETSFQCNTQYMTGFSRGTWSCGNQAAFVGKPGDYVKYEVHVEDGTYEVVLYLTRANDYGKVRIDLDGKTVRIVDLYSDEVTNVPCNLGKSDVTDGMIRLDLSLMPTEREKDGLLGLDCMTLKKIE